MSLNEGHDCRTPGRARGFRRHLEWTEAEDNVVRLLFPDYKALEQVLRHRTYDAIKCRAAGLGIVPRKHVWTNLEVSRLRKLYSTASNAELLEAFPGVSIERIKGKAGHIGLRRKPKGFKPTGHPLLDQLRSRCFELNLSMIDLDAMAGTNKFFQKQLWHSGALSYARVAAGVHAIGGTLKVEWGEED